MRYHDAAAAIEWLCEAFGFVRHLVVPGEGGIIAHAQLRFGNSMIMLGSARDDEFGKLVRPLRPEYALRVCIFLYQMLKSIIGGQSPLVQTLSWTSKSKSMVGSCTPVVTHRGRSGVLARMIPGMSRRNCNAALAGEIRTQHLFVG